MEDREHRHVQLKTDRIGKPEPLKYHLPGTWSRRVDDEHRLVYIVTDAEIIVLAARYHY